MCMYVVWMLVPAHTHRILSSHCNPFCLSELQWMHSLLIRIPEGVQPMLAHLESYIVQTGVDDMKACADVIFTDSEKYMEELLKLFNRFSTLVKEAFRDDSRFLTTRDKVNVYIYHLTP